MMSGSPTSPAGIPSPTDPYIVALIDRWVDAATQGAAPTIAAVVERIARARGLRVDLVIDGAVVAVDPSVAALEVPDELLAAAVGPWLPGFVRETLLEPAIRRSGGVHHTTPAMACELLGLTAEFHPFDATTVVADPAVGGGAFLLAACERLPGSRRDRVARIQGFDIDPLAVAVTRASLQLWAGGEEVPAGAIRVADALSSVSFETQPNVVVGNPPFLSQLRDTTTRGRRQRADLRRRWPDVGGYVDAAAAFLLAAVDEVADGGVVSLVQPSSFLSARDAAPVRQRLMREAPPVGLWVDGDRQFDAAVDTVAVIVRKAAPPAPVRRSRGVPATVLATHTSPLAASSWASLLLDDSTPQIEPGELAGSATVGDVAHVTAGFRDHFYGLRGAVTDDEDGHHRLITSGLIDPLECRWGMVPCRFDRQRWSHPTVDSEAVAPGIRDWIADRFRPKLLLASQTRVIEVMIDFSGQAVPGTPVVSVEPIAGAPSLAHLAAALTSPVAALLLLAEAAGSALSRDAVRVAAPRIAALPLPAEGPEWDAAAAAVDALGGVVDRIELIEIGRLGMAAYGLADRHDILNWWQERLPRR